MGSLDKGARPQEVGLARPRREAANRYPATAPSPARITVQPVRATGSVAWPTMIPRTSASEPGASSATLVLPQRDHPV